MRPLGMRAGPPPCAARAAATCSGPVKETRNVSSTTRNVTTAPAEGSPGASSPHPMASAAAKRAASVVRDLTSVSRAPRGDPGGAGEAHLLEVRAGGAAVDADEAAHEMAARLMLLAQGAA